MMYDFLPVSFVDFPGKIAATVFTSGCNFKCPYCHNSYLIKVREGKRTEEEFFDYLKKRANLIEGVCITGGEPTLWKGLEDFIKNIKELGFEVKLDTNGSRPEILERLIDKKLLDYIAMDIKAPKEKYILFLQKEEDIENVIKSVELIKDSGVEYEFRTTVNDKLLTLEDFDSIGTLISRAKRYVLQRYKYNEGVLDKELSGEEDCDLNFILKAKDIVSQRVKEVLIRD
ncbi:anaerobic ribonucleoside-triphosphate reductase activating protein [Caldanaerobacter sp.]|uniref:anaerobic ribonucleoside-triphosphate reductase activating protein n=1 Tax=Caldanaerobacter sp. TaxID=2930036 RepID=UPI003C76DECE